MKATDMYDDPRLKPRLTGDIRAQRRNGQTVAFVPVNGKVIPLTTPGDLPPNDVRRPIPASTAAARFMLGLVAAAERRMVLHRPLGDDDLWQRMRGRRIFRRPLIVSSSHWCRSLNPYVDGLDQRVSDRLGVGS